MLVVIMQQQRVSLELERHGLTQPLAPLCVCFALSVFEIFSAPSTWEGSGPKSESETAMKRPIE